MCADEDDEEELTKMYGLDGPRQDGRRGPGGWRPKLAESMEEASLSWKVEVSGVV